MRATWILVTLLIVVVGIGVALGVGPWGAAEEPAVEVLDGAPLVSAVVEGSPDAGSAVPDTTAAGDREQAIRADEPAGTLANSTASLGPTPLTRPGSSNGSSGVYHPPSIVEPATVEKTEDGLLRLTFRVLSDFQYDLPDPTRKDAGKREDQIPAAVREFHGKLAIIEGYMVPLSSKGGEVTSFYLARDVFGCCFGDMPRINEIVEVRMSGNVGVPMVSGIPVLVSGRFEVGEEKDEFGYVNSIYRLEATRVNEQW